MNSLRWSALRCRQILGALALLSSSIAGAQTSPARQQNGENIAFDGASSELASPADVIITDARIYTEDSFHQMVGALAVRNGMIIFTGSGSEAKRFARPKTKIERLGGKLVLPGLVDAHIHPTGIVDFGGCSLASKARTLAEITNFVRGCIQTAHVPSGHWLEVGDWEYGGGNQADPAHPTLRDALDAASREIPVVMMGWDGHHAAFNSAALTLAKNAKGDVVGYSKQTLATEFAQYKTYVGVDAAGQLTEDVADQGWLPIDFSQIFRDEHQKLLALRSVSPNA